MPLYEFKCKNCGHEFEELILTTFAVVTSWCSAYKQEFQCPKCGTKDVKRKPSLIGNTPAKWGEDGARESLVS